MTLEDARPGSEERFAALFRDEYPKVVRVAYLMLGDRAAAEDVAQEAFTRLYARWWRISRYDRPGAWVRRVVIRLAGRDRGRTGREVRLGDHDVVDEPRETSGLLVEHLVRLSRAQRAAVVLHYFEGRPVAEVADLLRCSVATAKVHLHRARKRLESWLEEERHVAG